MTNKRAGMWMEITWPWILAAFAALATYLWGNGLPIRPESKFHFVDKLVDFCSIGVGFWATALALLLALEGRDTLSGLKTLDIYRRIVSYFLLTVYSCFALLILCLYTIAAGRPSWLPHRSFVSGWAYLLTLTLCCMLRSFHLLGKLLRST
jgi:hypothetical protein